MLLLAVLVVFGLGSTYLSTRINYLPMALGSAVIWVCAGIYVIMGNTGLLIGDTWTQFLGFGILLMVIVPIGLYISRMGKTPISVTEGGKTFSTWDKPPKDERKPSEVRRDAYAVRLRKATRRRR